MAKVPEIEHAVARVGSDELGFDPMGLNQTDMFLKLKPPGEWQVADKDALKNGESYEAALRLSLDRTQLPKPFQVDAITDKGLQVEAKVLRWQFTAPVVAQ